MKHENFTTNSAHTFEHGAVVNDGSGAGRRRSNLLLQTDARSRDRVAMKGDRTEWMLAAAFFLLAFFYSIT